MRGQNIERKKCDDALCFDCHGPNWTLIKLPILSWNLVILLRGFEVTRTDSSLTPMFPQMAGTSNSSIPKGFKDPGPMAIYSAKNQIPCRPICSCNSNVYLGPWL
jgi:hypothetical protein